MADTESTEANSLPYRRELERKALHLLALVVPLCMALLGRYQSLLVLVPLVLIAVTGDVLRARNARFAHFIRRFFGFMMRQDEFSPTGGRIVLNGATWVLLSATLLTIAFPIRLAVPAFAMFMVADAAAALVGRRFGRINWGRTARTVEGSAAFLLSGLFVMSFFSHVSFGIGAAGVLAGCLAEAAPRPFNDNLRVPFIAALAMLLLEHFA